MTDPMHQRSHGFELARPAGWAERRQAPGNWLPLHEAISPRKLNVDARMVATMSMLWSAARQARPDDSLLAQGALLQMLVQLLGLRRDVAGTRCEDLVKNARGGLAPWQERRATNYLAAHLSENVSLEVLAGVVELSTFHFARGFKQSMGLPPHAYLRRLRCEKAKELLAHTSLPITEIAAEVGYETPQAFARMFRAEVGASPSDYRRQWRESPPRHDQPAHAEASSY